MQGESRFGVIIGIIGMKILLSCKNKIKLLQVNEKYRKLMKQEIGQRTEMLTIISIFYVFHKQGKKLLIYMI